VLCNEMPLDSALVCVMLDTVVYQFGYTSGGGNITFYFGNLVQGGMDITVTGRNVMPYEAIIEIQGSGVHTDIYNNCVSAPILHITPNPFRNLTTISLPASQGGQSAELKIFDSTGRLVKSFLPSVYSILPTVLFWDGTDDSGQKCAPGVYMCHFRTEETNILKKVILVE